MENDKLSMQALANSMASIKISMNGMENTLTTLIEKNHEEVKGLIKGSQDETAGLVTDVMTLVDNRFNHLDDKLDNMTFKPFAIRETKQA